MKRILEKYPEILTGVLWLVFAVFILFLLYRFLGIKDNPELLRGISLFVLGIGIAPLGLYLAYNRTESLRAQTEALRTQTETEKEKNVTDAFAKSVELLGNESIAVRQGGIYALGRIAGDNPELHPMIMDIVASYIRQESLDSFNSRLQEEGTGNKDELIKELSSKPVSMDIEAAVAVIRQRNRENDKPPEKSRYFLDLSNAYIFNAHFNDTKLTRVNFSDSVMMGCLFDNTDLSESDFKASNLKGSSFQDCDLRGADLLRADLLRADLQEADLQGANLWGANLWRANLWRANLWRANLRGAGLQGAGLQVANLRGAGLQGAGLQVANLRGAGLQEADLQGADLQGADLQRADLQGANLRGAKLEQEQVNSMKNCANAILPEGLHHPVAAS